ncbi:SigE family RNA polymerase sigma factor [Nocardioides sp. GXZ039]|uniref:SigE family RNA polymerase sigma factor n=1 Tax=Nocardioides sp. GXZ039 TaxID=3136018 RepID=UPI0030F42EB5
MSTPSRSRVGFVEYVEARRPHLQRSAYLLCGDPGRAEDIVQVALTRLYLNWPKVQRADSVDAYVRRSLVNTFINESKRPWRRERSGLDGVADPMVPGPSEHGEHDDDLWSALGALSPGQRQVVVLRHYWGLSVEETAADLGISTGTVKSQTHLALTRLRAALTGPPDTESTRRTS